MATSHLRAGLLLALILPAFLVAGCAKKEPEIDISHPANVPPADDRRIETTEGTGQPDIALEQLEWIRANLNTVYFDYDSYALRPDAREALKQNAAKIKQRPDVYIQIEGHCDERGTQEYNLALGEKRALATREYLMQLGVSGDRMVTISYGEEDPVAYGHNEAAWSQNRRCEFNLAPR